MATVDWQALQVAEFALPDQVDLVAFIQEAFALLASPDPKQRDGLAYPALATWLETGQLDPLLENVGEQACQTFGAAESHTRSFAALVLAEVVAQDERIRQLDITQLRKWEKAWSTWYTNESDLRGWVDGVGWIHALAHGADVAAQFAAHPRMERADLNDVLKTLVRRIESVTALPEQSEEDRIALAAFVIFNRPELTPEDFQVWLDTLQEIWLPQHGQPRSVAAAFAVQVARSLLVFAHLGLQPQGGAPIPAPSPAALQQPLLSVLKSAFPVYLD